MPYIKVKDRKNYDVLLYNLSNRLNENQNHPGHLNYIITKLCHDMVKSEGKNYTEYNKIIGVLECVKQEFYRKQIANYEDKKCSENGEI